MWGLTWPVLLPVAVSKAHARLPGPGVVECNHIGIEDGGRPVKGENRKHVKVLNAVECLADGALLSIVVEQEKGICGRIEEGQDQGLVLWKGIWD